MGFDFSVSGIHFYLFTRLIAYRSYTQTSSHSPPNLGSVLISWFPIYILSYMQRYLNFSVLWSCYQWVASWLLFPHSSLANWCSVAALHSFVFLCISDTCAVTRIVSVLLKMCDIINKDFHFLDKRVTNRSWRCGLNSAELGYDPLTGCCQTSNERSASIKVKEMHEELWYNHLFKNDSASYNVIYTYKP
jgi:hypothetical protein